MFWSAFACCNIIAILLPDIRQAVIFLRITNHTHNEEIFPFCPPPGHNYYCL